VAELTLVTVALAAVELAVADSTSTGGFVASSVGVTVNDSAVVDIFFVGVFEGLLGDGVTVA